MDDEKMSVLDDTILYIWKNARELSLRDVNRLIQELIEVIDK